MTIRIAIAGAVLALAPGCGGGGSSPALPPDADDDLVFGAELYGSNCASCHGAGGGGGLGPKLNDGSVRDQFDSAAEEIEFISLGSRAMPAFGERLSPDELASVVRYTREVISQAE